MTDATKAPIGSISWRDLTVPNAEEVKNFYCEVVGWKAAHHDMGDYHDFDIKLPDTGDTVTGICHARGENEKIPPQWIMYITVESVEKSAKRCAELGGQIIDGPRMMGRTTFCLIRDPAGAVAALLES